jgi:hypothetical protein
MMRGGYKKELSGYIKHRESYMMQSMRDLYDAASVFQGNHHRLRRYTNLQMDEI